MEAPGRGAFLASSLGVIATSALSYMSTEEGLRSQPKSVPWSKSEALEALKALKALEDECDMWLHQCATSSEDGVFTPAKEAICYMAAPESCTAYLERKRSPTPSSLWPFYRKQNQGPIALGGRSAGYLQLTSGVSVTSELRQSARLSVHKLGVLLGCNTLGWISAYLVCRAVKKARARALRTRALRAAGIAIDGAAGKNPVAVGGDGAGGGAEVAAVKNAAVTADEAAAEGAARVGNAGAENVAGFGEGAQQSPVATGSLPPSGDGHNADPDLATHDSTNNSKLQSSENNSGNDESGGDSSVKPEGGSSAADLKPCLTVSPGSPLTAPFCDMLPGRVRSSPSKSRPTFPLQDASAATMGGIPVRSRSQSDVCGNAGGMSRKGLSRRHSVPFEIDEGVAEGNQGGTTLRTGGVKRYDTSIAVPDLVESSPRLALSTSWVLPTGVNANAIGPEYFLLADSDDAQSLSGGSGGDPAEENNTSACQMPSTEMSRELEDNARSDCTVGSSDEEKELSTCRVAPAQKELELDSSTHSDGIVGGRVAEEMGMSPHQIPSPEKERELETLLCSDRHSNGVADGKDASTNSYTASFFERLRNLFKSVKPAPLPSQSRSPRDGNDIICDYTSASKRKSGDITEKNSTPCVSPRSDQPGRISSVGPGGGSPADLKPCSALSACPLLSAPIYDVPPCRGALSPSQSRPPLPQDVSGAMQGDSPARLRSQSDNGCKARDVSGESMSGNEKRERAASVGDCAGSFDCAVEVTALAAMSPGLASPPMLRSTSLAWRTSVAQVKASPQYYAPSKSRRGNKCAVRSEGVAVPTKVSGGVSREPSSDNSSGAAKTMEGDSGSDNGGEHDTRLAAPAPTSPRARYRPCPSVPASSENNASGKGGRKERGTTADRAINSMATNGGVERVSEPEGELQLLIDVGSPNVSATINAPLAGPGGGSAHSSPPASAASASGAPGSDRLSLVARGYDAPGAGSLGSDPPGLISIPGTNASSFTYSIGSWVPDSEISFFSGPPSSYSSSTSSACGVALPEGFTTTTSPHGLSDENVRVASSAGWGGALRQGIDGGNGGSPHYRSRSGHDTRDGGVDESKAGSGERRASGAPPKGINNVDLRGFDSDPLADCDDGYSRPAGVRGGRVDERTASFRQGSPVEKEPGLEAHARPDFIRLGAIGKKEGNGMISSANVHPMVGSEEPA